MDNATAVQHDKMIDEGSPAPKTFAADAAVVSINGQPIEPLKSDELAIGAAGFIAICDADGLIFTIAAKTRRELRAKVTSLIASEAKKIEVLEIYRARRLELASQVVFKF